MIEFQEVSLLVFGQVQLDGLRMMPRHLLLDVRQNSLPERSRPFI
jgi:hypothetical protein